MENTPPQPHLKFAVLATDIAILTLKESKVYVRLMDVNREPFFNHVPGLPGGLIKPEETAEETARRLIPEKAKLSTSNMHLEQLYTFSEISRDPRGRVVAVAYSAYIPWEKLSATERENQKEAWWEPVKNAKRLAYDHDQILALSLERLRSRVRYTTLISRLLPDQFTLTELEQAYETVIGRDMDKRNFRKKIQKLNLVQDTGLMTSGEKWRPAKLYRFKKKTVENIEIF